MTAALIVAATVALVTLLERRAPPGLRRVFDWVPAILLAYLLPAAASALLGLDLAQSGIHEVSRRALIPLAIVLVMSSLTLSELRAVGWRPVVVFAVGSAWIALFPVALVWAAPQWPLVRDLLAAGGYWRALPPIVGSWIGGSTSQLVLKEAAACPEGLFLTVLVLDNVLVNLWTILMFQVIRRSEGLTRALGIAGGAPVGRVADARRAGLHPLAMAAPVLAAWLLADLLLGGFVARVLTLSACGLVFGNFVPGWDTRRVLRWGGLLILAVMAVLGLRLDFSLVEFEARFFGLLVAWLLGHFAVMLAASRLLRTHAAWVAIGSMANVGGIATAPAVTAAYEPEWMPHAVLLAVLSMATGTAWGLLTVALLSGLLS